MKNNLELIIKARESNADMDLAFKKYSKHVNITTKKWIKRTSLSFDDLYQEGSMGLMKAIRNYDPQFGTEFTTWAIHMITGHIRNAIAKEKRFFNNTQQLSYSWDLDDPSIADKIESNSAQGIIIEERLANAVDKFNIHSVLTQKESELVRHRYGL